MGAWTVQSEGGRGRQENRAQDVQEIDKFYVAYKSHIDELGRKKDQ